jgi:hypothetical protein
MSHETLQLVAYVISLLWSAVLVVVIGALVSDWRLRRRVRWHLAAQALRRAAEKSAR